MNLKIFKVAVFLFFIALTTSVCAQAPSTLKIGYQVGNFIYFQWTGTSDNGSYVFMGYAPYTVESDTPPRYLWDSTTQSQYPCYSFNSVGGNCKINSNSAGGPYTSGTRGQFVSTPTNCPIDDYNWILLLTSCCIGFLSIKNNTVFRLK